jgi:hypothetical protein
MNAVARFGFVALTDRRVFVFFLFQLAKATDTLLSVFAVVPQALDSAK